MQHIILYFILLNKTGQDRKVLATYHTVLTKTGQDRKVLATYHTLLNKTGQDRKVLATYHIVLNKTGQDRTGKSLLSAGTSAACPQLAALRSTRKEVCNCSLVTIVQNFNLYKDKSLKKPLIIY